MSGDCGHGTDAERDAARWRNLAVVGWVDGYEFIGLPEQAARRPNAKPVYAALSGSQNEQPK
jgi:hypothetical protein